MLKTLRCIVLILLLRSAPALAVDGKGVKLRLELHNGRLISGEVSDYSDDQLLLEVDSKVLSFRWDDFETASAYQAKKKILSKIRGSEHNFTAEDHFKLGYFLATHNRHAAAIAEFRKAQTRDPSYEEHVSRAWKEIRRRKERPDNGPFYRSPEKIDNPGNLIGSDNRRHPMNYLTAPPEFHAEKLKEYKEFGIRIRDTIAEDLVLLETRNFLIWTDWPEEKRNQIPDWAEQMYNMLCGVFGFPQNQPIWIAKCPIFCFRNEKHFAEFAKDVDQYERSVLGYTKTASNGYVHVVLRRLGTSSSQIDHFATTMVHEATHAFMHCYGSPRNLPPWLSEGFADYVAERVLGERCHTGEAAVAVAKHYVAQNESIKDLFTYSESPPGELYPIAHSLVDYLIRKNRDAFVGLVNDIKQGHDADKALERHYKGLNTNMLELEWRNYIRKTYLGG